MRFRFIVCSCATLAGSPVFADDSQPLDYSSTTLTGNWSGSRDWLRDRGVTFTLTQESDGLANVSGGINTGTGYAGAFQLQGDFDLGRLFGWDGATVHASGYAVQGQGLGSKVGNLLETTSLEADPGVRLSELYLSQELSDGKLTFKAGQILADQNFAISTNAALFVNSTFGWPGIFANDLPGGGPAYPYAVPAVQAIFKPNDAWTLQAAIFNGSPTGSDPDGNKNGLGFPLGDGVLAIAEAAYSYTPSKDSSGLPGTYKIGAWYNSETFDSLLADRSGLSLADPASDGVPARLSGDYAIYAIIDQTLWREHGSSDNGLNGFLRVAVAPQSDRNLTDWYFDSGLTYKGLLPGRGDDIAGISYAFAHASSGARDFAKTENTFGGSVPEPTAEQVIEITYQAAVTPALSLQPFFQYIIRPGANAEDPDKPGKTIPNATVVGLRAAATF